MTSLTRWVLAHKRLVVAVWIATTSPESRPPARRRGR